MSLLLQLLLLIFVAFLLIAERLCRVLSRLFQRPPTQGRALTLPPSFELVVVVIVFQSLVELFGMTAYLWWVPRKLHPLPLV